VIIADNWKWFSIDPEMALKPFVTKKVGWMGLWLYIVDEMMRSANGSLVIRDFKEYAELPSEYSEGAIIELLFPKA
jgi:nitrogen fixation/metabolism regulation signal transduction histidine kinase